MAPFPGDDDRIRSGHLLRSRKSVISPPVSMTGVHAVAGTVVIAARACSVTAYPTE
jgi:hypothetical protein